MSSRRPPPPGQLEMPLVWELEPMPEGREAVDEATPGDGERPEPVGTFRLVLAAAADLGGLLLCFAAAWLVATLAGADPRSGGQLVIVALVALETASVAAVGMLWVWRGSPGLLLLEIGFAKPLSARNALRVWLFWLCGLPLVALPLLVGGSGRRPLERLGGTVVSFRSPRGGA